MKIFFLRHAEAEDHAASDFDRRLTATGCKQARTVGRFCADYGFLPEVVLSSPLVRAEETARIVVSQFPGGEVVVERWLASGMSAGDFFEGIGAHQNSASVMVVGHEPDFGETISAALGSTSSSVVRVRKASLTLVDFGGRRVRPGTGRLDCCVPVRLMGREE